MKIALAAVLSKLQCLFLRFSNKFLKCRWTLLLCLVIALVFTILLFLPAVTVPIPASPPLYRPKITNFPFFNKDLCASTAAENSNQRTAVIVVLSARNHFVHRNLVRQTYGSITASYNIRILAVVFILGSTDEKGAGTTDVEKLEAEMDQFGDIVMGDFVDSYKNLTLKTITGYRWLTSHCRGAQFVVKTDDDVLVNIFQLTKEMNSWSPTAVISSNIWCAIHKNETTIKEVESRFYASPIDFPDGKFPNHCAGIGYVTVIGVIDRIVDEISKSFTRNVCTHEDVFITAIVPKRINSIRRYFWRKPKPIELVNRFNEWQDFTFENGGTDHDHFLRNFIFDTNNENKTDNLNEFRRRYETKTFYLFAHTDDFSDKYLRFWRIIKDSEGDAFRSGYSDFHGIS